MGIVNPFEDDCCSLKYGAASEQSMCRYLHLQGFEVPLYRVSNHSALDDGAHDMSCFAAEEQSLLDSLLLAQWEDRAWKGLLRYDVTTCQIKIVGERRKLVCQLNEEWSMSFPHEIEKKKVIQQWESFRPSCVKIQMHELLLSVANGEKAIPELIHSTTAPNDASLIFIISGNPVEYGHVFLVPRGFYGRPQFMDARVLKMVTTVAMEINNFSFRVFYESHASDTNHLYFQAMYFANPLPVELMPIVTVFGNSQKKGIQIFEVAEYPIKALAIKGNGNLKLLVDFVAKICSCLQNQDIPFCLLISDCGTKMFLFPQKSASTTCALSAWECSGYFVLKERQDFDHASEDLLMNRMSAVSLDDEAFQTVKQLCCSVAGKLTC